MVHPERIREKMEEQKDVEQTSWVSFLIPFSLVNPLTVPR